MNESVCIIDWCGNHKYCGFWCDYYPNKNLVIFGGEWEDVPDLLVTQEPTQQECEYHAKKYTAFKWS